MGKDDQPFPREKDAMTFDELGALAKEWHENKHPHAGPERIVMKLAEEVGEVAQAHIKSHGAERGEEELADVLLCVVVGSFRYGLGNVFALAEKKLKKEMNR